MLSSEGSYETDTAAVRGQSAAGKALVFKLRRRLGKLAAVGSHNAGITVGRIDTNDVVIPESSVSRFHANFVEDVKTGLWTLRDVGSKNGTWIGPVKLDAGAEEPLGDRVRVRFGGIDLFFLTPESFVRYLAQALGTDNTRD